MACNPMPKGGRESGSGVSGGQATVVSSLDHNRTNRNKPTKRNSYCGCFTLAGRSPNGQRTEYAKLNCKSWGCPYCGPRRARRYKHSIRAIAEELHLQRLLTLTLDPTRIEGDPVAYLRQSFNKLRTYFKRRFGVAPKYIAILEFHENGKPHLHVLIDRFVEQAWLTNTWEAVGGGRIVDIRYVDLHRVARYLAKYLTVDLLLSAPKGVRRVTCSRGIVLLTRTASPLRWRLLRANLPYLLSRLFRLAVAVRYDDYGDLIGFVVETLTSKGIKT